MSKLRVLYCEDGWLFKRKQEQTEMQTFESWMDEARYQGKIIWGYEHLAADDPDMARRAWRDNVTPHDYVLEIGEDLELNKMTKYWLGEWGI
jgi:hypothetical protein